MIGPDCDCDCTGSFVFRQTVFVEKYIAIMDNTCEDYVNSNGSANDGDYLLSLID